MDRRIGKLGKRLGLALWAGMVASVMAGQSFESTDPPAAAFHRSELIFPFESWHNHGSSLVELPNGDLLVSWFHGSGERTADDVAILGARKRAGEHRWSEPFLMADTPGFPDTNCTLLVDGAGRLWLFYPTILDNRWESALLKLRMTVDYHQPGPPRWQRSDVLHMKPGDDFRAVVSNKTEEYFRSLGFDPAQPSALPEAARRWRAANLERAGDKLDRRLGWFTRAHPYLFADGRILVGLYSDGFSFASATYSDDGGNTWTMSEPIVGGGAVQPSFAQRRDGTLVAFLRDNGPPPQRILVAESADRGATWSIARDHPDLVDPGAGNEVLVLASGRWIVVHNDSEAGRHQLAISISEDEGRSFRLARHLAKVEPGRGRFHYPSVIQASDGSIHVTYSAFVRDALGDGSEGKAIRHDHLSEAWLLAGLQSAEATAAREQ